LSAVRTLSPPAVTNVECCPACGSREFVVTGAVAPGFLTEISGAIFQQRDYEIRDCSSCGLLFRTPRLSDEELSDFYAQIDYRVWELAGFHPTERAVHACLRRLPAQSRLLDFGCSSGRLLAPLVGDYRCCGIEINRDAAAAAARKGLTILPENAPNAEPDESFDAVVLVDVFEHLALPLQTLSRLARLLAPDGILIVVTGNGDCPPCRLDPAQFWYFRHAVHLCMLTMRHAQFIGHRLPLRLEEWNIVTHTDETAREHVRQRLQHWAYWQFRRRTALSQSVLPMIPFIRRARTWPTAPHFSVSRDHVVAVFRKFGGNAARTAAAS
jgi:SAM-dependent methyltransferase